MKKITSLNLLFLIFLLFQQTNVLAQDEENTDFSTQMNNVFSSLEKNRVPNGLLLDYVFEFAELSNYTDISLSIAKVSLLILCSLPIASL